MKKVLQIVTNKFLLAGIAFVVWVAYFDQNDWYSQKEREQELQVTSENIEYLRAEIEAMKLQRDGIEKNPKVLEKYAREHYHMKRDNEDVYVFK